MHTPHLGMPHAANTADRLTLHGQAVAICTSNEASITFRRTYSCPLIIYHFTSPTQSLDPLRPVYKSTNMSLQSTCPAITITKPKSKSKSKSKPAALHARLISFPLPDTVSDGGISTPWIAVASKTHSSLDSDTPEIKDLADSLISAYTEDLVFVTTPILLCVSPLQESGDYASDEHISMPSGTSELLPQP